MRALPRKNGGLENVVSLPNREKSIDSRLEKYIVGGKT